MLQFTIAEDFYPCEVSADEIRFTQHLFVYHGTRFECIELIDIYDRIVVAKRCVVKSALRQSSDQRHLSALESESDTPTGTRLLTFVAFAAGLSVS
jgi:hypothetical protein